MLRATRSRARVNAGDVPTEEALPRGAPVHAKLPVNQPRGRSVSHAPHTVAAAVPRHHGPGIATVGGGSNTNRRTSVKAKAFNDIQSNSEHVPEASGARGVDLFSPLASFPVDVSGEVSDGDAAAEAHPTSAHLSRPALGSSGSRSPARRPSPSPAAMTVALAKRRSKRPEAQQPATASPWVSNTRAQGAVGPGSQSAPDHSAPRTKWTLNHIMRAVAVAVLLTAAAAALAPRMSLLRRSAMTGPAAQAAAAGAGLPAAAAASARAEGGGPLSPPSGPSRGSSWLGLSALRSLAPSRPRAPSSRATAAHASSPSSSSSLPSAAASLPSSIAPHTHHFASHGSVPSRLGGGGPSSWPWSSARGRAMAAAAAMGGGGGGSGGGTLGAEDGSATPPEAREAVYEWREGATVRVISIVPTGAPSPYRTTWDRLVDHTATRFEWLEPSAYQMMVFRAEQLGGDAGVQQAFLDALKGGCQMVVGFEVAGEAVEAFLRSPQVSSALPGLVVLTGGAQALALELTRLPGGLKPQDASSWRMQLARRLPWTPDAPGVAVWDTLQLLLGRHDSDNFLFVYLVLVNQYVTTVPMVADTTKGIDLGSLICMIKNCGSKVVGCVQDPTCKSALDCLQSCSFNDQVCQYRCIVSYESPLLEQFSLCILQLHNCRNLNTKPPLLPDPAPMASFRGTPLTHEAAEDLFLGWIDQPGQGAPRSSLLAPGQQGKPFSWLVAAGKNPAYDYFPCQHQLYYRGKGKGQIWYEPIFKAITLDGRQVWRRRVYRVRRGKVPGTFHLSVLDNGVTSNEYWRILDCADDLAYCLFYYSGAASAAGLAYSGAVLGTPDGAVPAPQHTARLEAALRRAGIEPWELSFVDNTNCADAPLHITGPAAVPAAA